MNYLITGGCGFIGSNYINHIFNNKNINKIINIDAMYYCASIYNIKQEIRESKKYHFYHGNINNYDLLVKILKEHEITHVIHFAAQSHVDNSFNESLQYTYDNVKGTHTLLEAIKNTNLNIILLHFSTDEVYGESDENEMNEKSILCPTNPYSASKAAAEMFVKSYIYSFNMKAIISRGNNVFGYNQYPEKLIPKFMNLLKRGKKCTIHGKGDSIRNFIFIDDVNSAVDIILKYGAFGQVYNIGSDHKYEKSVIDIAKMLIKKLKNDNNINEYLEYVNDRPFNDKRYLISNQKLIDLGWEQKISLDVGIDRLIQYNNDTVIFLFKYNYDNTMNKKFDNFYKELCSKTNCKIYIISHENDDNYPNNIIMNFNNIFDVYNYFNINFKNYSKCIIINNFNNFNINDFKCKRLNKNNLMLYKNMFFMLNIDESYLDLFSEYYNNNDIINPIISRDKINILINKYKFDKNNIKIEYFNDILYLINFIFNIELK